MSVVADDQAWRPVLSALNHQSRMLEQMSQALTAQREAFGTRDVGVHERATEELERAIEAVAYAADASLEAAASLLGRPVMKLSEVLTHPNPPDNARTLLMTVRAGAERAQRDLRINSRLVRKSWAFGDRLLRAASGEAPERPTYAEDPIRRNSKVSGSGRIVDGTI